MANLEKAYITMMLTANSRLAIRLLRQRGYSIRGIRKVTGHDRKSIAKVLSEDVPTQERAGTTKRCPATSYSWFRADARASAPDRRGRRNSLEPFAQQLDAALAARVVCVEIMALVAEKERDMISQRTRDGLAAARRRGIELGNPRPAEALKVVQAANLASADAYARRLVPVVREIRAAHVTALRQIAQRLNARGYKTPHGKAFKAQSVKNLLERVAGLAAAPEPTRTTGTASAFAPKS